jgi:hypothetical protein
MQVTDHSALAQSGCSCKNVKLKPVVKRETKEDAIIIDDDDGPYERAIREM